MMRGPIDLKKQKREFNANDSKHFCCCFHYRWCALGVGIVQTILGIIGLIFTSLLANNENAGPYSYIGLVISILAIFSGIFLAIGAFLEKKFLVAIFMVLCGIIVLVLIVQGFLTSIAMLRNERTDRHICEQFYWHIGKPCVPKEVNPDTFVPMYGIAFAFAVALETAFLNKGLQACIYFNAKQNAEAAKIVEKY